jgi:hypothetical protein
VIVYEENFRPGGKGRAVGVDSASGRHDRCRAYDLK